MSPIRAFIALPVGEEMRSRIAAAAGELKALLSGLRWISDAGWHLTLRFLGSASAETLVLLEAPLQQAAERCPAGQVRFTGLGVFPPRGAPRVLWLGVSVPAPLLELQAACETAAVAAGFPRDLRPFHPHVTLARWRERIRTPQLPAIDLGSGAMESLVLFRSDPGPAGAVYSPLATFPLRR